MIFWDIRTELPRFSRRQGLILAVLILLVPYPASGNGTMRFKKEKDTGNYFAIDSCGKMSTNVWLCMRQSLWKKNTSEVSRNAQGNGHTSIPKRRFADLQGVLLKVGVLTWPLCLEYNKTTRSYSGYCWEILLEIAQRLNFTFLLVQPSEGQWGVLKNGTWNGLMGMLDRKEVDLVAMPLTETAERSRFVDFACPFKEIDVRLWMLDPRRHPEKWLIIFDILGLPISGLLILTIIIVGLLCSLRAVGFSESTEKRLAFRLTDNFFLLTAKLMRQASPNVPFTVTGRTLLSFWWWFCFLLSVIYSGTIIATLADTRTEFPFTTIREMLSQDEYKWGFCANNSIQSYIESSKMPLIKRLQKSVQHFSKTDPTVLSPYVADHENKMEAEKYVYIGNDVFTTPSSVNFIPLREVIYSKRECFGLPSNSPLTEYITDV